MAHLANLKQLEWPELPYAPIGDEGVAQLVSLKVLDDIAPRDQSRASFLLDAASG